MAQCSEVPLSRVVLSLTAEVDLVGGGFTDLKTNRELASSPAQNEAFTGTVAAVEEMSFGKAQQLRRKLRCLSLQGVGLVAF